MPLFGQAYDEVNDPDFRWPPLADLSEMSLGKPPVLQEIITCGNTTAFYGLSTIQLVFEGGLHSPVINSN